MLAYLDADMELCVLDTRAGTELEHASLSTLGMSFSSILPPPPSSRSLSYPTTAAAPSPPAALGTYHNAFRACEGRLYLLGRQELRAVRVQGWSQRVESLVQAGEWLEALAVALDHFEQKILPAENAAAAAAAADAPVSGVSAHGDAGGVSSGGIGGGGPGGAHRNRGGDPWGGGSSAVGGDQKQQQQLQRRPVPRSEAAEHINDLLTQYLRLAINNAPAAEAVQGMGMGMVSPRVGGSRINLAHSHFQMLAGVCAEFCAVTGRLDMLFGQIFQAFRARGQQG